MKMDKLGGETRGADKSAVGAINRPLRGFVVMEADKSAVGAINRPLRLRRDADLLVNVYYRALALSWKRIY